MPQISMYDAVGLVLSTMEPGTMASNLLQGVREEIQDLEDTYKAARDAVDSALYYLGEDCGDEDICKAVHYLKSVKRR